MTSLRLRHRKYVIKMTLNFLPHFLSSSLGKILVALLTETLSDTLPLLHPVFKATFTDMRNLIRNLSTFSFACLFYFTVHRCTKLFGPKEKINKQVSEKVEKIRIKFRRSVNVAYEGTTLHNKSIKCFWFYSYHVLAILSCVIRGCP